MDVETEREIEEMIRFHIRNKSVVFKTRRIREAQPYQLIHFCLSQIIFFPLQLLLCHACPVQWIRLGTLLLVFFWKPSTFKTVL